MSKIKSVSTYDGSEWGAAVPLGADDINIDITNATTNPSDSTSTVASLDNTDVIVGSGDTNADAWTKFNRFRKRVANNLNQYIRGSITTTYNVTNGSDTAVYSTNVINNRIATMPNPNLLENWYFGGGGSQLGGDRFPINQQGLTSYQGYNIVTIDKWKCLSSQVTISLAAGYLQIIQPSSTVDICLKQYLSWPFWARLAGKTVTFSALLSGNHLITQTVTLPTSTSIAWDTENAYYESSGLHLDIQGTPSDGSCGVRFYSNKADTYNIIAVKLEIGDVQTLAHQENSTWILSEIPNWTEESRKCYGHIVVQDKNITSGTTPSSNIYGTSYYLNDSNNFNIATWQIMSLANGREGFQLVAGKKVNDVNKFNYLRMSVDANGNPIVEVNGAAAWRTALNTINKNGDTVTGVHRFKGSNLDKDVAASAWSDSYPVCVDKDGDFLGNMRAFTLDTGVSGVQLTGQNGSYQNFLRLGETANNEHYVSVSAPATWRAALNTINKAGDTMTGNLIINGGNWIGLTIKGASGSPSIKFSNTGTRLSIDQYAEGSSGGERYLLPSPDTRSADVWYTIITNKSTADSRRLLGLCYAVNDTFNSSYAYTLTGHITSSSTTIYFDFEVPKSLENISTVSITTLTGSLRGVSGYLDNNSNDVNFKTSPYTSSATKISDNRIRISIVKSTAFQNVVNNSPVSGFLVISLKFT